MKAIICIDNNQGIAFNKRRISQDTKQREDIFQFIGEQDIYMSAYSARLYDVPHKENIHISNNYHKVCNDAYYLFEDDQINQCLSTIQELIVYCWNRDYPFDRKLLVDFTQFESIQHYEFTGSSHAMITRTLYKRGNHIENI